SDCHRIFTSSAGGPKNGTFRSPIVENPFNFSKLCNYEFHATDNERVMIMFTGFNLRGSPPDCSREYLDIYAELTSKDQSPIESPFGGRYCARSIPHTRVSLYQTLELSFHTTFPEVGEDAFEGTFEFIDASKSQLLLRSLTMICRRTYQPFSL
ncbi:CUB domain-containing protein 2-like protein, partial [Leptotrombidium deliense]